MSHPGLIAAAIVLGGFVVMGMIAHRQRQRAIARTLARRANPTYEEFCDALNDGRGPDVEWDITTWWWDELLPLCQPALTPHPDDHILADLCIAGDEPGYWLMDFCEREGLNHRVFPDWPKEQLLTVGNFARWLSAGRRALTQTG